MVYTNSILQKLRQLYLKQGYFEIPDFDSIEQFNFCYSESLIDPVKGAGSKWKLSVRGIYTYGVWNGKDEHPDGIIASVLLDTDSAEPFKLEKHHAEWLMSNVADKVIIYSRSDMKFALLNRDGGYNLVYGNAAILFKDVNEFTIYQVIQ